MRHFFIDKKELRFPETHIRGSDANHIKNVLRLKPGTSIRLFDGEGMSYNARLERLSHGKVVVSITNSHSSANESWLNITIAQSWLKEKKMDILVRQLTELGINRFIPVTTERSVPRPGATRFSRRKMRWTKIARSALTQCRRSRIPKLDTSATFNTMLDMAAEADLKVVFWEQESALMLPELKATNEKPLAVFALLGPEGGFSEQEMVAAGEQGFVTISLGPRILRAETATVAACTALQLLYGDMAQADKNILTKIEPSNREKPSFQASRGSSVGRAGD